MSVSSPVGLVNGRIEGIGRLITDELAKTHRVVHCELASREDRARMMADLRAKFTRIDLLVNIADLPHGEKSNLLEASEKRFDDAVSANLKAPHFLSQAVARWMLEQKQGRIVFVTPVLTEQARLDFAEYCISSAGLGMSRALYTRRLTAEGIYVFEIRGEAEESARLVQVIRAIANGELDALAGQALYLNAGSYMQEL